YQFLVDTIPNTFTLSLSPMQDSARRALAAAVQPSSVHANPQEALWSVHPGARNALWSGLAAYYRQVVERLLDDDQYDELATFATQPNTVVLVKPFMDLFQYLGDAREQRKSFFKALRNFSTAIVEVKLKAIIDEARACPNKDYLLPGLVGIERVFKGEARDGYTTIIIDDTAVPAILNPIQDPPSPAPSDSEDDEPLTLKRPSHVMPSDSEDDEPVTVLMSPVQDPPSVATRPDPTRYVAHKKKPSPTSSDSEDDEPAPSHLPVPPPLLVSLPLSPPTPPTPGVADEMPSDEAVTAALETFLLGSSVGAEVEVGGDEFAEAAGMVDAIVERLADPPTPSAPSAPSAKTSMCRSSLG
ncbi:hypothetical protein CAPTEDRAFT_197165, partial [Capitella teleta]